jgi:hypothetical protein
VHLLFLDESGQIDQDGLFALGGIAVRDTDRPELRRMWQETLSAAGWPLDREIEQHYCERNDLVPFRIGRGRLAVEDCVTQRHRHIASAEPPLAGRRRRDAAASRRPTTRQPRLDLSDKRPPTSESETRVTVKPQRSPSHR